MVEGCLSLSCKEVDVMRSDSVWLKAVNEENKKVELKYEGLIARILQHEINHLDGILIMDRCLSDKQNAVK